MFRSLKQVPTPDGENIEKILSFRSKKKNTTTWNINWMLHCNSFFVSLLCESVDQEVQYKLHSYCIIRKPGSRMKYIVSEDT